MKSRVKEDNLMKYRLREQLEKNKDNLDDLSKFLGITYQTLSKKMNGHVEFTRAEIKDMKKRYNLDAVQIDYIFFTEE